MNEVRCSNCYKLVPSDQTICPYCGALVGMEGEPDTQAAEGRGPAARPEPRQQPSRGTQPAGTPSGHRRPASAVAARPKTRSGTRRSGIDPSRVPPPRRYRPRQESNSTAVLIFMFVQIGGGILLIYATKSFSGGTIDTPGYGGLRTSSDNQDPYAGRYLISHHVFDRTSGRLTLFVMTPGGALSQGECDAIGRNLGKLLQEFSSSRRWFTSYNEYQTWQQAGATLTVTFHQGSNYTGYYSTAFRISGG